MARARVVFAVILLAAFATSCDKLGGGGSDAKSKDSRLQLHLPSGWHEAELPGSIGKIQAKSGPDKNAYVSVISEAKEDIHQKSIQDYARFIRRELGRRLSIRHTPEVSFHYDEGLDATERVARLLDEVRKGEPEGDVE